MSRKNLNQYGFTLIEIIVAMVILSVFSVMIVTFLSKSLWDSSDPVRTTQNASKLNIIIANITADYNKYPKWRSNTPYDANSFVVPTARNGEYYKTAGACTSGANEPEWPSSGTIVDGTCTWTKTTENGSLLTLEALQTNINNKVYETAELKYEVVPNDNGDFIYFDAGTEKSDETKKNLLKVTITNSPCDPQTCVKLTSLFASN